MKATPMQKRSSVIIRFYDAEPKHVMEVMLAITELAAKRDLDFEWVTFPPRKKLVNMKLAKKAAVPARKGVNPFTKEPCVFKAKPASMKVRVLALKKLKAAVN